MAIMTWLVLVLTSGGLTAHPVYFIPNDLGTAEEGTRALAVS